MKRPNFAGSRPRLAGTVPYFWVSANWLDSCAVAAAGRSSIAAKATIAGVRSPAGCAVAKMALSGQADTHAMQPTHFSAISCGMRGDSVEKSRTAADPGGISERARPSSAGRPASPVPLW